LFGSVEVSGFGFSLTLGEDKEKEEEGDEGEDEGDLSLPEDAGVRPVRFPCLPIVDVETRKTKKKGIDIWAR
jgi:hypothetical protein